ncbi:MAG: hypothetical protein KIT84_40680 [Labilithrix sp.]|nr:hypothetical protein [Labilithrix sp.]MCW5817385.1 hypothetical protein [Labilithrix sp.]
MSSSAQTTSPPPKPAAATTAFADCRAQQKVGDATACWKVWLSRYAGVGTEAEVAYAEEHAQPNTAATAPPAGEKGTGEKGVVEKAGGEKAAGEKVAGEKAAGEKGVGEKGVSEKGAGERAVTEGEPAGARQPPSGAGASPSSPRIKGAVLDFCAPRATKTSATRYEKQRLVLFAIGGAERLEEDPSVAKTRPARLLRDVFAARFPMPRFDNVLVDLAAKPGWESAETLPIADVEAFLATPISDADDDGDRRRREAAFARYSIRCTDYVAFPVVTGHAIKWAEHRAKSKDGGERTVKTPDLEVNASLAIFKRDGSQFRKVAVVSASVPGIADRASDAAASTAADVTNNIQVGGVDLVAAIDTAAQLPQQISAVPDVGCIAEKIAAGRGGVPACFAAGDGPVTHAAETIDERMSAACRKAMRTGEPDDVTTCEVRVRAFQLARSLQKEARSVEGWKLFGVLSFRKEGLAVNLGEAEGVRVGYGFEIRDAGGDRIGYLKVIDLGPGGDAADEKPSYLDVRAGEITDGARLSEYPQIGLSLTPFVSAGAVTASSSSVAFTEERSQRFLPPTAFFGGGASVGYDLSSLLGWSEVALRVSGAYLAGYGGENIIASMIPIELSFEKGLYLARRLTLVFSPGFLIQHNSVQFKIAPSIRPEGALDVTGTTIGPSVRVGLDVMLHPDWSLRLEGATRMPLTTVSYEGPAIPAWLAARSDHFMTVGLNLGLAKTF